MSEGKNMPKYVKVTKNFCEKGLIDLFRFNLMKMLVKKKDFCQMVADGTRPTFLFGEKRNAPEMKSFDDFELIENIKSEITTTFDNIIKLVKTSFKEEENLYVSSFSLASQNPGSKIASHEDTDNGDTKHFKYSCILYLNTLQDGGELKFEEPEFSIKPEEGDLIFFKTKEAGFHSVDNITKHRYTICVWLTTDPDFSFTKQN